MGSYILSFQLLGEENGPSKADDSKLVVVNSYVVFGSTIRSGFRAIKVTKIVVHCT